jgi:ribosomal protein S18 acetylase RimI-like enzyme
MSIDTVSEASFDAGRVTTTAGISIGPLTMNLLPQVVEIHLDAFKGSMGARLGSTYIKAFLNWLQRVEGAIALVARDEHGKAVGYVIGAPLGYDRFFKKQLFWIAACAIMAKPWLLVSRHFRAIATARIRSFLGRPSTDPVDVPTLPEPAMSLVGIAVAPSAQGKKIGLQLVREFETKARERGFRSLRLSVYPDNKSARRLYEKCDWQPVYSQARITGAMYYLRLLDEDGVHIAID